MKSSILTDIAEFHTTWRMVLWVIKVEHRIYKRSTMGHYYHAYWHPLAVDQETYVMDDFGNLIKVYDRNWY